MEKQRIMAVLRQTGLREEADQYREQARQRLRDDGKGKQEAVEGAWDAMAEKFLPLAEQATPGFRVVLPDGSESLDDALDPEYAETNPVRRMRERGRTGRGVVLSEDAPSLRRPDSPTVLGKRAPPGAPGRFPHFLPTTPPLRIAEGPRYVFPCRFGLPQGKVAAATWPLSAGFTHTHCSPYRFFGSFRFTAY